MKRDLDPAPFVLRFLVPVVFLLAACWGWQATVLFGATPLWQVGGAVVGIALFWLAIPVAVVAPDILRTPRDPSLWRDLARICAVWPIALVFGLEFLDD